MSNTSAKAAILGLHLIDGSDTSSSSHLPTSGDLAAFEFLMLYRFCTTEQKQVLEAVTPLMENGGLCREQVKSVATAFVFMNQNALKLSGGIK